MKFNFKNKKYLFIILLVLLVPFGFFIILPFVNRLKKQDKDKLIETFPNMGSNQTRGVRNNNPLNLRISNNAWKNKIPLSQNTDKSFEQFTSMEWGLRAALINMRTQITRGHNTIRKLISVWAPTNENDTENYIKFVSLHSNITENARLKFEKHQLREVVRSMVRIESAFVMSNELYDKSWSLI